MAIGLPGATDCHFHVYDDDVPVAPGAVLRPAAAPLSEYRRLQRDLGLSRAVVVQPSTYGTDNRLILRVVADLGRDRARAVAVVGEGVSDNGLETLHRGGVRGIRFNLSRRGGPSAAAIRALAGRVAALGWHVQMNTGPDVLLSVMPALERCPLVVIDHMGHVPAGTAGSGAAYLALLRLLAGGNAYVKLSGFYKVSAAGAPGYGDAVAMARRLVEAAPDRLLWGSDWPHPTEAVRPDDAALFGLLDAIAPDPAVRRRILVENPARLYGF